MDLVSLKQRFGVIGNSELLNRALEVAVRVAPTDLSVLVTGESGVGKEFFPQIIHAYSARKHNKYIAVNCGAIPEGTIDSELFGHEKGLFIAPSKRSQGLFREADWRTIFLNEVSKIAARRRCACCACCRRANSCRRFGLGAAHRRSGSWRLNEHEFAGAIEKGRFREDLYWSFSIRCPSRCRRCATGARTSSRCSGKFASDVGRTVPYAAHHARRRGAPDS